MIGAADSDFVTAFTAGTVSPAGFTHSDHVRLAYLLLLEHPLPEVLILLREGIKRLAARAGHPEKYHETITFAFAAIINERMARHPTASWTEFAEANPDLLDWRSGGVLSPHYDAGSLADPIAKATFVLP